MADTARPLAGPVTTPHAKAIAAELAWLAEVIEARLKHFFEGRAPPFAPAPAPRPDSGSALGRLITTGDLTPEARLILVLAMAPHVNSAILDPFFVRNTAIARVFSQFGGVHAETGAFQPTAETALFLLAGADTAARIAAMALFDPDHPLRRLAGVTPGTTQAQALTMPVHRVIALCEGRPPRPDLSPGFPAQRLDTCLTWDDLVLPPDPRHSLDHIVAWLDNRDRILGDWGLARHVGHGFKALFYGPPRHRQDADRGPSGPAYGAGCLPDRPVDGGFEIYRRDREEPRPRLRHGGRARMDPVLRRGGRAVRHAHGGDERP